MDKSSVVKEMEKELWNTLIIGSTKETGSTIWEMAGATNSILITTPIQASLRMVKLMEKVCTPGQMEKFMMGSGITVLNMAMAYGKVFTEILTSVNGEYQKQKATEYIHGRMATDTRESGRLAWNMAKEQIYFAMVMFIPVSINMENLKERDNIYGKTAVAL
jgi:hypothetical protein